MRTLKEVIAILAEGIADVEAYDAVDDALYYLREYQQYQNTPSRNGHMALVDYFEELQKNEPLTWEELKQMVGKPIWIEYDNRGIEILSEPKQWVIISLIDNTSVMPEISLVGKWKTFWMQKEFMGKHWNAYKKEKHDN